MPILRLPVRTFAAAMSALGFVFLVAAGPAPAVTITVYNADSSNEGLNSSTGVSPVGKNPGTTLGAQRLFILEYAADVWSQRLDGDIPVIFTAKFDPMGGDAMNTTLGFAAPTTLHKDFLHAPAVLTWYPAGLANQFYGTDLNDLVPANCPAFALPLVGGKCPDLFSRFNSDVDGSVVLGTRGFYYGLDGNGGNNIDFLSVALHEMGHGLGLLSLIDPVSGKISPLEDEDPSQDNCQNCSDSYSSNLEDASITPKKLSQMTNGQRLTAIEDVGKVFWTGAAVRAVSDVLSAGRRASDGAVSIYTPDPYEPGSSVSHLNTTVSPSEMMEPRTFSPPQRDLLLMQAMFEDVGWTTFGIPNCGDPNADRELTSSDALIVLSAAVGAVSCDGIVCNVNYAGGVSTTDALLVLKRAVGQDVTLICPLL